MGHLFSVNGFTTEVFQKKPIMDISGDTSTDGYNTLSSVTLTTGSEWFLVVDLTSPNVPLKREVNRHPHVSPTVDPCHHPTPLVMTLFQVGLDRERSAEAVLHPT